MLFAEIEQNIQEIPEPVGLTTRPAPPLPDDIIQDFVQSIEQYCDPTLYPLRVKWLKKGTKSATLAFNASSIKSPISSFSSLIPSDFISNKSSENIVFDKSSTWYQTPTSRRKAALGLPGLH
ncbi:UNVERIFIED_CONTAM: hypothetical protein Sangu_2789100 [Sesamum angustifolium]|uniref:Uncharacterized protein n=1 Tax=Sesamum angustifolium TaxID=2727405 RepID=A0AAW2IU45_9LAMI